jgi:Transposase IS66 family
MKIPEEITSINPDELELDENARAAFDIMMNLIEQMTQEIHDMKMERQELRDEVNRLKGEKGKPKIKSNVPKKDNDIPRKKKTSKSWKKRSKKPRIKIDRKEPRIVDRSTIPPDATHKGHRRVVIQNIKIVTDNVEYLLERFYSPSERKTYEAQLPDTVDGEFDVELYAYVHHLYFECRVPEKKILRVLSDAGIVISSGQISNILTKKMQCAFSQERKDILEAGMNFTNYFHIDDTGARHKGVNHYTQVICTALFSVFFITRKKNRDAIKEILGIDPEEVINKILISDDARQFWLVAIYQALCWIHEIRHYKKLSPSLQYNRKILHDFLTGLWDFYDLLDVYRNNPSEDDKDILTKQFDDIFSTKTGYDDLDKRIALTREKKTKLLLVLDFPEIPLHNNPAEIALREMVIKRKISYGTRSEDGKTAWENMFSIRDTCRKLGVNFMEYVKDIFSGEYKMPRLADLIRQKASEL